MPALLNPGEDLHHHALGAELLREENTAHVGGGLGHMVAVVVPGGFCTTRHAMEPPWEVIRQSSRPAA